eukprot:6464107-Amphidinium_carterae.1
MELSCKRAPFNPGERNPLATRRAEFCYIFGRQVGTRCWQPLDVGVVRSCRGRDVADSLGRHSHRHQGLTRCGFKRNAIRWLRKMKCLRRSLTTTSVSSNHQKSISQRRVKMKRDRNTTRPSWTHRTYPSRERLHTRSCRAQRGGPNIAVPMRCELGAHLFRVLQAYELHPFHILGCSEARPRGPNAHNAL